MNYLHNIIVSCAGRIKYGRCRPLLRRTCLTALATVAGLICANAAGSSPLLPQSVGLAVPATAELTKTNLRTLLLEQVRPLPVLQDQGGKVLQTLLVTVRAQP